MTILSDIEKVTDESFLFVLFDTLFLISPGLLIIYYFHRDLFLNLDSIKLVLLSIATTLPFLCWNIILIFQLLYRGKSDTPAKGGGLMSGVVSKTIVHLGG